MQLLLATRNPNKTHEFAQILGPQFELSDLNTAPLKTAVAETGKTFEENAAIKAVAVSQEYAGLVVADDSGLEVDALDGTPGVFSARFAEARATDEQNVKKLLRELDALPRSVPRSARFRCVLALARNGALLKIFEGTVEGKISDKPKGDAGFGYDPIFIPEGFEQTFGELPAEVKNRISHRARAVRALREALMRMGAASA
jgi:XTP/dITP diphosphohydrolase